MTESDATDQAKDRSQPAFLSAPLRINEIVLLATLGCYVSGFAITNLYLGSMGVASFDILRARYVLAGLLFVLFLSAVLFPLREAQRILYRDRDKSLLSLAGSLLFHTILVYSFLYFAIAAVGVLAGSVTVPPVGIPQFPASLPWDTWYAALPDLFRRSLGMLGVLLLVSAGFVVLIFVLILIIRPRTPNGHKPSLREVAKRLVSAESLRPLLMGAVGTVVLGLAAVFVLSILHVLSLGRLASAVAPPFAVNTSFPAWVSRFAATALALYLLGVVYIVSTWRRASMESWWEPDEIPKAQVLAVVFRATIVVGMIVPVYTLAVYPGIPQQIGGGRVIPVQVGVSRDEIAAQLDAPSTSVYLIDRTSKGFLLLVVDAAAQTRKVMEIDGSEVQSVTYEPGAFGKMELGLTPAPATSPINQQQATPEPTLTAIPVSPP